MLGEKNFLTHNENDREVLEDRVDGNGKELLLARSAGGCHAANSAYQAFRTCGLIMRGIELPGEIVYLYR
jgi:hypothetical protein